MSFFINVPLPIKEKKKNLPDWRVRLELLLRAGKRGKQASPSITAVLCQKKRKRKLLERGKRLPERGGKGKIDVFIKSLKGRMTGDRKGKSVSDKYRSGIYTSELTKTTYPDPGG